MADFILNRKIIKTIPVEPYPFPEGAFKIYGGGKFYNGFSIGDTTKLSVVNKDGVLKFSRGAANQQESTEVILGTVPHNNKVSMYIDIASPIPQDVNGYFKIGSSFNPSLITEEKWTAAQICHTTGSVNTGKLQAGGVLRINFSAPLALEAIPNLCEVRAIWAL